MEKLNVKINVYMENDGVGVFYSKKLELLQRYH